MWILPFLVLQLVAKGIETTNYRIQHEGLKFVSYDKEYLLNPNSALFRYNDTSMAYNMTMTFLKPVPNLMVGIRIFVFRAKHFRRIPYELDRDVCQWYRRNDFGIQRVNEYSNFRGCPFKANYLYYLYNFIVDDAKVPRNLLIPGKFRVNVRLFYRTVEYAAMQCFASIVPEKNYTLNVN